MSMVVRDARINRWKKSLLKATMKSRKVVESKPVEPINEQHFTSVEPEPLPALQSSPISQEKQTDLYKESDFLSLVEDTLSYTKELLKNPYS